MSRWILGSVLLLAAIAALWRFHDLGRDPDVVTETSQESWGDPVYYLYNARSRVLFGNWRPDESGAMYIAPGYSFLAFVWMSLFGVTYTNMVGMAVLAGFVVIASTAMMARAAAITDSLPPIYAAGAAGVLLLGSYVFFAVQRVPVGDMEALALSSLAALALTSLPSFDPHKQRLTFRALGVLAGIAIGIAPFVKFHNGMLSIAAVAAWIISYFWFDETWKIRWRYATLWLVLGLAIAAALWVSWAVWLYQTSTPHVIYNELERLRLFTTVTAVPDRPEYKQGSFEVGRFFRSNLLYRQPLETLLGTLGFFTLVVRRRRNWPLLLAATWWFVGFAVMTVMTVDPLRYRIVVWPAVVIIAAHFWTTLMANRYRPLQGFQRLIVAAGAGAAIGAVADRLVSYTAGKANSYSLQILLFLISIIGVLAILQAFKSFQQRTIALTLALVLVALSLPQWISGERKVSHELLEASRRLDKYPANYVLGGGWGVRLAFSSPRDAYFLWTPESIARVQLFIEDPYWLSSIPLPWHELERHKMRRLPLEIAFVSIDR